MNFLNLPQRLSGARTVRAITAFAPTPGVLNVLSFKEVHFIDPFSLVLLAEYLRYLKFAAGQAAIYLPTDAAVLSYLRRSRFVEFAAQLGAVLPASKAYVPTALAEEWLLPLTPLRSEEEVPKLIAMLYERLFTLIEHSLGYPQSKAAELGSLLAELCQNVTQHSEDLGLVAAQIYRDNASRTSPGRRLQLAVGDLGLGLRGSLAKRYQTEAISDAGIIKHALERGISAIEDNGRGLGLSLVYLKTTQMGGSLLIRSGQSLLSSRGGVDEYEELGYFPGTQIALEYRS